MTGKKNMLNLTDDELKALASMVDFAFENGAGVPHDPHCKGVFQAVSDALTAYCHREGISIGARDRN